MMKWLRVFSKSSPKSSRDEPVAKALFVRSGPVRVSVGLDFGTHSTKAAFFQFGAGARVIRPLWFHHTLQHWPHFAIPAVGVIRNGGLVWGAEAAAELDHRPWNQGIRRLKVLLAAGGDRGFEDQDLLEHFKLELLAGGVDPGIWHPGPVAAAALAYQISEVYRELRELYPGRQVDAQFAIPAPIDHVQDSAVLATYRRVANTAEELIAGDGALRYPAQELVAAAADAFARAPQVERPDGRVYTLPEAVAQVASYLTSLEATPGVHGVIDIGAGTTDISIFSLRRPQHDVQECFWYGAVAIPKASAFVYRRLEHAADVEGPSLTEAALLEQCKRDTEIVARALEAIRRATRTAWFDAYGHLKKETAWHGCPVFLCGGGALLPRVGEVFKRCWVPNWPPHDLRELPTPRDFHGDGVPFHRMTVAYGLAVPKPEHGRYVLPKDSPDHTPPKRYKRYEGMGGDQLYPTPGWV